MHKYRIHFQTFRMPTKEWSEDSGLIITNLMTFHRWISEYPIGRPQVTVHSGCAIRGSKGP